MVVLLGVLCIDIVVLMVWFEWYDFVVLCGVVLVVGLDLLWDIVVYGDVGDLCV